MLAILELQLDIIKLRLLLEEWNDRYEDLKEENKKLKEELDHAYDFIDRYVYKTKDIRL